MGGYNINNLRYADDTALTAKSEKELHELLNIAGENENRGLTLNKTEDIPKKQVIPECKITVNGTILKQVEQV